jgi:hypothetical protein|nr:MAG TPA: hypothetical protein [Caudoviricetes sp.]
MHERSEFVNERNGNVVSEYSSLYELMERVNECID